ncbi:MAG TPA: hypothetical protein PLP19_04645 [bacterium]|nr:hypothetical protein [bacterium]HPN42759.1 hypothetical protein [bacterium]
MQQQRKTILLSLLSLFLLINLAFAQVEDNLARYQGANGEGYMKPLVSGLTANMNRGWYQSASIPVMGIRLRFGLVAMMAPIPDDDKTFKATTSSPFTPQQTVDAPTVVGEEKSVYATGTGGNIYPFPGGLNMNVTAFAAPQLTVGLMGSEIIGRYFAAELGDADIGDLTLLGIGVRHSISQYLVLFPVDISVGAFWQSITVGDDLLDMKTLHYGVQVSKNFAPLIIYGGVGFDNGSAKVDYTYEDEFTSIPVELDIKNDSALEITAGVGLNLAFFHLSTEAAFGSRTAFALNATFGL